MNKCKTIGIDLAKNTFYLIMLDKQGKQVERKKLNRQQLIGYLSKLETCVIAMEACGTAHYWGRKIGQLGHSVVLLPAQHVKGYLRGQKNDYNDAKAIAEACQHGAIRPVAVKSLAQQDDQTFLLMRQHVSSDRKRLINHVRGLLAEYGVVLARGSQVLRKTLPFILEDVENGLTDEFRALLFRQYTQLERLDEELQWYDERLAEKVKQKDVCQRLIKVPGIGPVVSFSLRAWMGSGEQFKRGRDASAALGLVPKQFSTGGREVLLGITKRGNQQLRSLVVHGARAVVSRADGKTDRLSQWILRLVERRGFNKAVVALANKIIRIAWVIICGGESYKAPAAV
ncbi:IS110 family transposase [Thaumasiovibrio subtropicus]|uniref:IS110 family transposase n=1 Tax=Thaumasiovibrio subtropicus TaxID=1891207 RepID=UPI000B3637E7|nr:IS110 family transposase [Thaumasiovibrio subtropicus]